MANNTARLGDLATYVNGYAFKPSDWGDTGLPIIRIQDLTGNSYQLNRYEGDYPARIEVNDGDVLISWSASLGVYVWQRGKALLNQHIFKVVFDKLPINKDYFVFAVEHKLAEMESKTHGATMKHIVKKDFDSTTIPYPAIEKQAEIAERLRRITALIEKQKEQLLLLDQLVKSRFIELFGDYVLSHAQSDWKSISEIGKVVGGATPKTNIEEYWDGEYRWITPAELSSDSGYIYDSVRKLTKAGVDSCSLQEMPIDTVILSSRAPIGKVAIAGNTFYCNQGFKNIICNKEILPRYLYTVLLLNTEYLNSLGRGATFKEISKSIVENIRVPVPPIELQEQFTAFVEQTDKSKLAVQQGLQELEILKKSLMQQYFG